MTSSEINTNRIPFLNTYIDNLNKNEAIQIIDWYIQNGGTYYVVTPNSDIVVKMQRDIKLKAIFDNANLILTDGMMLIKIARFLKNPIKERVSMTDFVWNVLELAIEKEYRVFFLGGKGSVLERAISNIKMKLPGLQIAGFYSPPFGFEKNPVQLDKVNSKIKRSRADILLVFLGCPKQEYFIYQNKDIYKVPISITMGGCVDFIAGKVKRAPKWMQNAGLEWFFRFLQEPRRMFKRYFIDDVKIFKLVLKYKYPTIFSRRY